MVRHAHHRSKTAALPPHARRRLSEEGRRLLLHALSHDGDDGAASVDLSVVSNRGDTAADSDLEGFPEWQQPTSMESTKKTKKRHGHRLKDQYDNDGDVDADAHDALDAALEQLSEKRDATKIQALQAMLRVLESRVVQGERLHSTKKAITSQALTTLKKRSKDSGVLALRVLAVLAVTLGPDEQVFFETVRQPLRRLVSDDATDPAVRMEAAYALCIASYVCCREDAQRWHVLDVVGAQLVAAKDADDNGDVEDEFTEELLVAVIECWAFLISGFHPSIIVPKITDPDDVLFEHVEALAGFVREAMNPVIRSAACEALALLVQDKYMVGKTLWNYTMEETTSPLGGLESKIQRYMHETAKSIGKKNRKTQRSMLKEVLETLRSGEGPHKDLQIGDETLSISTWSRFFQANVLRRALLSGFQVHLHENAVLREVFDVAENANAKISMISTVRRRADHRSKTINKRNDMSRKDARQNAFLYED